MDEKMDESELYSHYEEYRDGDTLKVKEVRSEADIHDTNQVQRLIKTIFSVVEQAWMSGGELDYDSRNLRDVLTQALQEYAHDHLAMTLAAGEIVYLLEDLAEERHPEYRR